jgi:hypothetical protein
MTIVVTGHSTSLEGFIGDANDSSERPLFLTIFRARSTATRLVW